LKNPSLKGEDSSSPNGGRSAAPEQTDSSANPPFKGRDCASSEAFKEAKAPKERAERPRVRSRPTGWRDCSRINLWPLAMEGRQEHPVLYRIALDTLRAFYGPVLDKEPRLEERLLDAILAACRETANSRPDALSIPLEKLSLQESPVKQLYTLQPAYYRMLKGTKRHKRQKRIPSLLELFSMEKKETRICLKHCANEQLQVLFGAKAAALLHGEIAQSKPDKERICDLCAQAGAPLPNGEMFELLDLHFSRHVSHEKIIVQEHKEVCLKKRVFLEGVCK
jgi:hypothetical protein